MDVPIRSDVEIDIMRQAGRILSGALDYVASHIEVGVTGIALDKLAESYIQDHGAEPAFKGYGGYPASLCLSINDEVVHGIPSRRIITSGDVVSIDLGVKFKGWNVDAARTIIVPPIKDQDQALVDAAWESFDAGVALIKPGVHLGDVQAAIQAVIERGGYGLVRDLTGHGIGQKLHEAPDIPNYGQTGMGIVLKAGMTFCIEPMLSSGDGEVVTEADDWTITTLDHSRAAHVEETLLVTASGVEILTAGQRKILTR